MLRGPKRLLNRVRRAVDHNEARARWPFRFPLPLLPMSQRIDTKAEARSERLLRHAQRCADRFDVHVSWYVDAVALLPRASLRIRDRLLETLSDAVASPAHARQLLYVSINNLVRFRNRSARPGRGRSARSSRMPGNPVVVSGTLSLTVESEPVPRLIR